jgi:hypothetical protein
MFRYVADGVKRSSADLVRSLRNIIRHGRDLLGVLNEEQVVITKVLHFHLSDLRGNSSSSSKGSLPCHPWNGVNKTIDLPTAFVM